MRRVRPLPVAVAVAVVGGVGASLLLGSVLAVVVDSVTFDDNHATTGEVLERGGDIQVARTEGQPCDSPSLDYSDGPFTAEFDSYYDLDPGFNEHLGRYPNFGESGPRSGGEAYGDHHLFCLRNLGGDAVQVSFVATELTNVEIGEDCVESERDAGDDTCEPGDPGEVDGIYFWVDHNVDAVQECKDHTARWDFDEVGELFEATDGLPAGETCMVQLGSVLDLVDDDAYLRAQSDELTYTITMEAQS